MDQNLSLAVRSLCCCCSRSRVNSAATSLRALTARATGAHDDNPNQHPMRPSTRCRYVVLILIHNLPSPGRLALG
eukprot:scaffold13527_cov95-Isochrysis_galbana.AAC.4